MSYNNSYYTFYEVTPIMNPHNYKLHFFIPCHKLQLLIILKYCPVFILFNQCFIIN